MYKGTAYTERGEKIEVVEAKTIHQLFRVFRNKYSFCVGKNMGREGEGIDRVWAFSFCEQKHHGQKGHCLRTVNIYIKVEEM